MEQLTQLLHSMEAANPSAAEELLPLVYQELRRHAAMRMAQESRGHTLQATALVHEAWLRLSKGGQHWQNRGHFFAAAAEAMRRILIEQARRRSRIKRGGDMVRVDINDVDIAESTPSDKLLLLDEALEALRLIDPEKAQVVTLKFYLGLSDQEAAACLQVSERTINRHWAYSKAWLFQHLQAS